jgi:hypothetical protein
LPDPQRQILANERKNKMSKRTVTKLFVGGALAAVAGAILAVAAVWVGVANDAFVMDGPDIVGLREARLRGPCWHSGSSAHSRWRLA